MLVVMLMNVKQDIEEATIPDYINDPARILELVIELLDAGWSLTKDIEVYEWSVDEEGPPYECAAVVINKHLSKATAFAWLKMKESEK